MAYSEIIKKIIKENDSNIEVGEGSGVNDLLIKPLSSVFSYYHNKVSDIEDFIVFKDPSNVSNDVMDALASNFLLSRKEGNVSRGYVKISFEKPQSLTLPKNTKFSTSDGKIYNSSKQYSITKSQMSANLENSLYLTGLIAVEAEEAGEDYTIRTNEINEIVDASFNYVSVWNPSNFSKGEDSETNEELYNRILLSVTNETASSETSVKNILGKSFEFKDLSIKGFGDEEMLRDIVYSGIEFDSYVKLDLFGKRNGFSTNPHNENISGFFTFSGIEPPDITSVTLSELSDSQYQALYKKDNGLSANVGSLKIVDDDFSDPSISSNWTRSDSKTGYGVLRHPDEINLENSSIQLGLQTGEVSSSEINVSYTEVKSISDDMKNLVELMGIE
jgi:hypothetical protein